MVIGCVVPIATVQHTLEAVMHLLGRWRMPAVAPRIILSTLRPDCAPTWVPVCMCSMASSCCDCSELQLS